MQRGLQAILIIAVVIMAGFAGYLYFRQIPKEVAKNTEPVFTVATPEGTSPVFSVHQIESETVSIETTEDLNLTSNDLDETDLDQLDKELGEIDF